MQPANASRTAADGDEGKLWSEIVDFSDGPHPKTTPLDVAYCVTALAMTKLTAGEEARLAKSSV